MATMDDNIGAGRILDKHVYQPSSRFFERMSAKIALLLHVKRGRQVHVPLPVPVADVDIASLAISNSSTITDNPGPGRVIDKYIYRVLLRTLERCAGRIAMSTYLPAFDILKRIEEIWYNVEIKEPCFVCRHPSVDSLSTAEKIRMAVSRIEDAPAGGFILSGAKEITKRLR